MRVDDSPNFRELVIAKGIVEGKFQRVEPELGGILLFCDVDVRWFITIRHVKEEAVSLLPQNGRHVRI